MTITLLFTLAFLTIYTAQILWRGFLNLWDRTYDDITADCSRVEHFYPTYRRDPTEPQQRFISLI